MIFSKYYPDNIGINYIANFSTLISDVYNRTNANHPVYRTLCSIYNIQRHYLRQQNKINGVLGTLKIFLPAEILFHLQNYTLDRVDENFEILLELCPDFFRIRWEIFI